MGTTPEWPFGARHAWHWLVILGIHLLHATNAFDGFAIHPRRTLIERQSLHFEAAAKCLTVASPIRTAMSCGLLGR